jgi:hypothetical protein
LPASYTDQLIAEMLRDISECLPADKSPEIMTKVEQLIRNAILPMRDLIDQAAAAASSHCQLG